MNSDNKSKETVIQNCSCYYFDDIIDINDLHLEDILKAEKPNENILIHNAGCKTTYGEKSLYISSLIK